MRAEAWLVVQHCVALCLVLLQASACVASKQQASKQAGTRQAASCSLARCCFLHRDVCSCSASAHGVDAHSSRRLRTRIKRTHAQACVHAPTRAAAIVRTTDSVRPTWAHLQRDVAVLLPRVLELLRLEHVEVLANVATRVRWLNDVVHKATLRRDLMYESHNDDCQSSARAHTKRDLKQGDAPSGSQTCARSRLCSPRRSGRGR